MPKKVPAAVEPAEAPARQRGASPETLQKALRQSRYIRAQERISRIVRGRPALTDEQLAALALLLYPGGKQ